MKNFLDNIKILISFNIITFVHLTVIGVSPTAWHFNSTFSFPFAARISWVFSCDISSRSRIIFGGTKKERRLKRIVRLEV